jgi:hypothetical protein
MRVPRELRERSKTGMHGFFELGQSLGWDILPRHFYSSIPEVRELRRRKRYRFASVFLSGLLPADIGGPEEGRQRLRAGLRGDDGAGLWDGRSGVSVLLHFIAAKRPRRIVQVGSGLSTAVILIAAKRAGYQPRVICVDPRPAQEVELSVLITLDARRSRGQRGQPHRTRSAAADSLRLLRALSRHLFPLGLSVQRFDNALLFRERARCCTPFSSIIGDTPSRFQ